ncbi:MAG: glycosyltransferase family 4 protein [Pirellulaceae bacterium]
MHDPEAFVLHTHRQWCRWGPEKTILNSPRYLRQLGYESACLYLHPEGDLGIETLVRRAESAQAELLAWPDGTGIDTAMIQRLADYCRHREVAIWHAHDYKTNVLGLLVRRKWPMKLVTTTHGWCVTGRKSWLYATVGKACLPFYDATLAVSDDLYRSGCRWAMGKKRVHFIENAIDSDVFVRRRRPSHARRHFCQMRNLPEPGDDDFLVVSLGRLAKEKAYHDLIAAVSQIRLDGARVVLWIGGDGPCWEVLQKQIQNSSLSDSVTLLGHVDDPRPMIEAADAFVLSSTTEGLPNVLLEAMAMETAIVSTRVGGIPKLIEHEQDGLLVDPGQPTQLTNAIHSLITDPLLRERLALKARDKVVQQYDFRARMLKVVKVYDQLIGLAR